MTNGLLSRSVRNDVYVCMLCQRRHPSALLMRRCSHGVEKETKENPTDVKESNTNTDIIVPFGNLEMMRSKIEGFDLDKLRQMGKDLDIPHAAVKGKVKLVDEILEFLKSKGEV